MRRGVSSSLSRLRRSLLRRLGLLRRLLRRLGLLRRLLLFLLLLSPLQLRLHHRKARESGFLCSHHGGVQEASAEDLPAHSRGEGGRIPSLRLLQELQQRLQRLHLLLPFFVGQGLELVDGFLVSRRDDVEEAQEGFILKAIPRRLERHQAAVLLRQVETARVVDAESRVQHLLLGVEEQGVAPAHLLPRVAGQHLLGLRVAAQHQCAPADVVPLVVVVVVVAEESGDDQQLNHRVQGGDEGLVGRHLVGLMLQDAEHAAESPQRPVLVGSVLDLDRQDLVAPPRAVAVSGDAVEVNGQPHEAVLTRDVARRIVHLDSGSELVPIIGGKWLLRTVLLLAGKAGGIDCVKGVH